MDLRLMAAGDQFVIRSLLQECRLPVDDLNAADIEFVVAAEDESILGAAGLEMFGDTGLLRSVAVQGSSRGDGLGTILVQAIERRTDGRNLKQLVLLTETAAPFFAKLDYVTVARNQTPLAIRQSAEFRSLCPASATGMTKPL